MDIQALKNKVLQLAIEGKLVEQRPEEGTGKELFDQIQGEKQKLIAEGKIKKEKALDPITDEEIPFEIPDRWKFARFAQIVDFRMGKTPPRENSKWWIKDLPWVSISDMPENGTILETKESVSSDSIKDIFNNFVSPKGTLLMSFKLTVGRVSILGIDATHNEAIISIFPFVNDNFITRNYLFYILPYISQYGETKSAIKGKTLNSKSIANLIVPLPPLEEQKRIVAKIEEIFSALDKLQMLFDENANIKVQLKKKILQYAIEGKLVEQRPEEGTGQDLFNQIQEEKQKLIAEGKIKKEKALAPITEDEIPFDIPESWRWCRLVSLFQFINGDRGKNYPSKDKLKTKGIPFISAINLKDGKILHDEKLMCLSNEQYDLLSSGKLQKNDIVICIRGSLGKHAVFTEEQGAIASSLVILRQPKKLNSMVSYVSYFIDSKLFFDEISQTDNGTAQPNLSSKNLENFIFPLPPLAEQKRIVSKVEELFALCDKLDLS